MKIDIQFSPRAGFSGQKINLNKQITMETINNFETESEILNRQNLLIYFGWKGRFALSGFRNETYGFIVIKNTPRYKDFIRDYQDEINVISKFAYFKCIIYLARDIGEDDNKISKNFTIIHELQHVLQYASFKSLYQKHCVLYHFYKLKRFNVNDLPSEHDAFKKAKLINYKISGKKEVDIFLEDKIKTSSPDEKMYWESIKNIDINEDYDLVAKTQKIWEEYEEDIKQNLKTCPSLSEAYEYYQKSLSAE